MPRKKRAKHEEVELNLAAMLDMAFQLLTFFILTFKPMPVEGQISMRMPPPHPIATLANKGENPGQEDKNGDVKGYNTLAIYLTSDDNGGLDRMAIGQFVEGTAASQPQEIGIDPTLQALKDKLNETLGRPDTPFDQVMVQVGSNLKYEDLMRVLEICSRVHIGGDPKNKLPGLSLVEAQEGPAPAPSK